MLIFILLNRTINHRSCDEGKLLLAQEGLRVLNTGLHSPWSVHNFQRAKLQHGLNNQCNPTCPMKTVITAHPNESMVDRSLKKKKNLFCKYICILNKFLIFFPKNLIDDVSDKSSAFGSRHDLSRVETPLPDWVVVGESVLVRPYSYSGVIVYVGPTEFASGTWIGIELDAPTGKIYILKQEDY